MIRVIFLLFIFNCTFVKASSCLYSSPKLFFGLILLTKLTKPTFGWDWPDWLWASKEESTTISSIVESSLQPTESTSNLSIKPISNLALTTSSIVESSLQPTESTSNLSIKPLSNLALITNSNKNVTTYELLKQEPSKKNHQYQQQYKYRHLKIKYFKEYDSIFSKNDTELKKIENFKDYLKSKSKYNETDLSELEFFLQEEIKYLKRKRNRIKRNMIHKSIALLFESKISIKNANKQTLNVIYTLQKEINKMKYLKKSVIPKLQNSLKNSSCAFFWCTG